MNIGIGEENVNIQGIKMKIIKYNNYTDIDVQFEDGCVVKNKDYGSFHSGHIRNPNIKNNLLKDRTGENNFNTQGELMTIIKYNGAQNIEVLFEKTKNIKHTDYKSFKKGNVFDKFYPSILGVGYIGNTVTTTGLKPKETKESYKLWSDMLLRCYYKKNKNLAYKDCIVCDEWLCYENFEKWYNENYYEIEGEKIELDKDILCHNLEIENKIYSPDTCIFVPRRINLLFIKRKNYRGNCSIGVFFHKRDKKYVAQCQDGSCNPVHLGYFDTEIEAFKVYKEFKEKLIKKIAEEYKRKIPKKLYNALYSYKVNIND